MRPETTARGDRSAPVVGTGDRIAIVVGQIGENLQQDGGQRESPMMVPSNAPRLAASPEPSKMEEHARGSVRKRAASNQTEKVFVIL